MTNAAPSPPPKLPVSLAANPMLSSWVHFSREGQVTVSPGKVEIGQGIVTALAQIAADELDVDIGRVQMVRASTAGEPQRGRHLGQPFDAAIGPRDPACLRRNPADFSCRRVRSAGRRHRRARDQRRHDLRTRQYQDQLLGARRQNLAGSRGDAGRRAEDIDAARAGRKFRAAAGYPRQGFRASALHPRFRAAGHAAWPRAAIGNVRAQNSPA